MPYDPYSNYPELEAQIKKASRSKRGGGCFGTLLTLVMLLALIIFAPLAIGFAYDYTADQNENFTPPGRLVSVLGHQIHLNCSGTGRQTVILEADLANWSIHWSNVQSQMAEFTRVCSYDRSGLGWSQSGPQPRTIEQMVLELHTLLVNSGERAPFVLVGHGYGAALVRKYQREFPTDIGGVVLIDALDVASITELPPVYQDELQVMEIAEAIEPTGLIRLIDQFVRYDQRVLQGLELPPAATTYYRASYYDKLFWQTAQQEYEALPLSAEQMGNVNDLGDLPLVVLWTRNRDASVWPSNDVHQAFNVGLLTLSTRAEPVFSEMGKHYIQVNEPTLVIESVRSVVNQLRR